MKVMLVLRSASLAIALLGTGSRCVAATFHVPPDALPQRLEAADVLDFGPGASTAGDPNAVNLFSRSPAGILPGSTINVLGGVFGDSSNLGPQTELGSVINLVDGEIGGAELRGGTWNIYGGQVDRGWSMSGGTLNVEGGSIRPANNVTGGTINVRGGFLSASQRPWEGTARSPLQIHVMGGVIHWFDALPFSMSGQATMNLHGGEVRGGLHLGAGSTVNLNIFVTAATLNGLPLSALSPGIPFKVLDRDVTLAGVLADGVPFSFPLNSTIRPFDFTLYPRSSSIHVILVPEFPANFGMVKMTFLASMFCARGQSPRSRATRGRLSILVTNWPSTLFAVTGQT
jgi:hypothetical protein